ncbi:hypothetical protein CFIMG_005808RA [Ceratocystis fimbriata CBS 114723]|uniref:Uncharacterized protein n=1 Tax=Ceratocystis fimbriata CBS 114723 TaxID=1035309 RepID=A0A2C5X2Z3_9PEZI|nr:hypothetical protein CFIMG_005808RA [Ceratocystis fimbriata CBS 114723]
MQAIPSLVGTSCAVAAASSGLVFGQALPDQDRAHTSYISRSASLAARPRSTTGVSRLTRPFSQDCEPAFSRFSRLFVSEESESQSYSRSQASVQSQYQLQAKPSTPANLNYHYRASSQSLKDSSHRQIQHQSSTISSATVSPSNLKTSRPSSRRYTLSKQLSFRRTLQQHQPVPPDQEPSLPYSRSQTPIIDEDCSTSVSSHGSWIRRLSRRPASQHGSPRSSSVFDTGYSARSAHSSTPSPSHRSTYRPGSSSGSPAGSPLSRNKLAKRPSSAHKNFEERSGRRRALSQLSGFRRPATSHQRSATLQSITSPIVADTPTFVLDQQHLRDNANTAPPLSRIRPRANARWSSFFHAHTIMVNLRSGSNRFAESKHVSGRRLAAVTRRMHVGESAANSPACLLKSDQLYCRSAENTPFSFPQTGISHAQSFEERRSEGPRDEEAQTEPEHLQTPPRPSSSAKVPRRSLSMTLSSPGNWISKTGSLRRFKRNNEVTLDTYNDGGLNSQVFAGKRSSHYAAAATPLDTIEASILCDNTMMEPGNQDTPCEYNMATTYEDKCQEDLENKKDGATTSPTFLHGTQISGRQRKMPMSRAATPASTPPSPLEYPQAESMTPQASAVLPSRAQISIFSGSQASSDQSHGYFQRERSSTIASSDIDGGDAASRDDDTDFRSERDVVFDSIRTHSSMLNRAVETPLESVFNDSPPGTTTGAFRHKRPSILPDPAWDAPSFLRDKNEDNLPTPVGLQPRLELVTDEYNPRLSMTDDLDDDWGDFDHSLAHGLSPPSVQGSMNMNSLSPNMRQALRGIGRNQGVDESAREGQFDQISERPLSNLFDWTESSIHVEGELDESRPRTVHGKHDTDTRGGRTSSRRSPLPAHIRSQSVPVVNDPSENAVANANPKFGTWGMGSKTASEDWGEDFEFGDEPTAIDANTADSELRSSFLMLVPASIQASQPSLRAHTGHIRELSLLVNDLKRLCRHGRELNLTSGSHQQLWEEAEGIIALASPDDEELESGVEAPASPIDFPSDLSDQVLDDSFDEADISRLDDLENPDHNISSDNVPTNPVFARRRSVLMPDDDIFGGGGSSISSSPPRVVSVSSQWPLCGDETVISEFPQTPNSHTRTPQKHINGAVRSVAAAVHHSSTSDNGRGNDGKFHFDTTSLKTLVKQASDLRGRLACVLHQHDPISQSPVRKSAVNRASPAFTQVFNNPATSPSRLSTRPRAPSTLSISSLVVAEEPATALSEAQDLGQRMQLVTLE